MNELIIEQVFPILRVEVGSVYTLNEGVHIQILAHGWWNVDNQGTRHI